MLLEFITKLMTQFGLVQVVNKHLTLMCRLFNYKTLIGIVLI